MEMKFKKTVGELTPEGEKGFRVSYNKFKETFLECELDKDSRQCKKLSDELGIDWLE